MAFTIKQNDTSPAIQATLKDGNGSPIMKSVDGVLKVSEQMTIVDADTGVVKYEWATGDTDTVGTYYVEFQVNYADLTIETFPNSSNIVILIKPELA
jgi:hypothetical protein